MGSQKMTCDHRVAGCADRVAACAHRVAACAGRVAACAGRVAAVGACVWHAVRVAADHGRQAVRSEQQAHQAAREHAAIRAAHHERSHVALHEKARQSAVVTVALVADDAQAGAGVLSEGEEHLGDR